MEIGLAYDLVPEAAWDGGPDDRFEEYDSPATVSAVAGALEQIGHRVRRLGSGRDFVRALLDAPPDLVFNMAEGSGGRSREAHVPAVCEMLSVPYTHSDALTLAATLDKSVAKAIVAAAGVRTPAAVVVEVPSERIDLRFPVIAKPLHEGSSMGLRSSARIADPAQLRPHVERLLADYGQPVLVEEFCPGAELTVGIIGTGADAEPIGVMEIVPVGVALEEFVYSLEIKRGRDTRALFRVPPDQAQELCDESIEVALASYRALYCRDVARVDLRVDGEGRLSFLEVNPLPGLTPGWGDIVLIGEGSGVSFEAMLGRILDAARTRLGI